MQESPLFLASNAIISCNHSIIVVICLDIATSLGRRKMNRASTLATALIALVIFVNVTGCTTLTTVPVSQLHDEQFVPGSDPVAHIYADNWGFYLFKYIPIISGALDRTHWPLPFVLFTNNVRVDALVECVTREAHNRGGTLVTDLRTRDRSYWVAWTLFFWLNEFEVSANTSAPHSPPGDRHTRPACGG
jgi:hypothetical protein